MNSTHWLLTLPCFLVALLVAGCADDPFPQEEPKYVLAFVIDRSGSNQDYLVSTAFGHFSRAKDALSQQAQAADSLVIISQINGNGGDAVLFEGSPRAFQNRFPDRQSFLDFINQTPPGLSPVYRSCSETMERLCRRHVQSEQLHSLLLIYSDMADTQGGQDQFDASVRKYAAFPCAIGIYGAHETWADYLKTLGVRHCVAFDDKRVDPPLPELP